MTHNVQPSEITAESALPQCTDCEYFREEQADTGFCRFHKMYVLHTLDCPEFMPKSTNREGGPRISEPNLSVKKQSTTHHP